MATVEQQPQNVSDQPKMIRLVNKNMLPKADYKAHAVNLLATLGYLNNDWSTYKTMEPIYKKLKPGLRRSAAKNIKENMGDWNKASKDASLGNAHENGSPETDGCNIAGLHRVCRRTTKEGDDEIRIHPDFASSVFEESNGNLDNIEALPIRNGKHGVEKQKITEFTETEEHSNEIRELEQNVKLTIAAKRRLLSRLKKKMEEADKLSEEYEETHSNLVELEKKLEEFVEQLPEKTSRKRKNKDVGGNIDKKKEKKQKKGGKHSDIEDEMERYEMGMEDAEGAEDTEEDLDDLLNDEIEGAIEGLEEEKEDEYMEDADEDEEKKDKEKEQAESDSDGDIDM